MDGKKTKFFPFILDVARVDQRNPYNRVDRSGRKDRSVDLKNGFIDFYFIPVFVQSNRNNNTRRKVNSRDSIATFNLLFW